LDKDRYPILHTACDRAASKDTSASEKSVEKQLMEYGITPLHVPSKGRMPYKTIDRLDKWRFLLIHGEITILKDKCPNFVRELMDLEWADPKYVGGKTKQEVIISSACDMHAIDAFTYGVYCGCTKWRRPAEPIQEVTPSHMDSFMAVHKRNTKPTDNLFSMIGSF